MQRNLKRIDVLVGEYPPDQGGVADYSAAIYKHLVENNISVHLWQRGNERGSFIDSAVWFIIPARAAIPNLGFVP